MPKRYTPAAVLTLLACLLPSLAAAQGLQADYDNAANLYRDTRDKVFMDELTPGWIGEGEAFWYRKELSTDRTRYTLVNSITGEQRALFDHRDLTEQLIKATGQDNIHPDRLPLQNLSVQPQLASISFNAFDQRWAYNPSDKTLAGDPQAEPTTPQRDQRRPSRDTQLKHPTSPDGKWEAFIKDHNLFVKRLSDNHVTQLTEDGTAADGYSPSYTWSPDSSHLVCVRIKPGDEHPVTMVDSSPNDQLQPKLVTINYLKPGDKVTIEQPCLFDLQTLAPVPTNSELASNPYDIREIRWRPDSSSYTYEYNQRGHQAYRVIEVDAATGKSRAVINEEVDTFFFYNGRKYVRFLDETNEIIWMSERSGWNHLYLYDRLTGNVKNPITSGHWLVRDVIRVDEDKRQVWFWAGGIIPDQDPYYRHLCRVNLDGTGLTVLTQGDGEHTHLSFSPDGKTFVTTYSRVDLPPVHELRSAETGELIAELARAVASALYESGMIAPERFVAKGRDGTTDIYGVICKPRNFDPSKSYPVIEYIYAGPHDSFVPKPFYAMLNFQPTAEIGFILVQIDGMGTSNRSKAFHDVCWKNLKDSGFPDRIAWMKAAAETRPWMDLSRVGVYGGSAGGQSAMRAVLDHADFYKAAAADCGCHDNRMDKIWWNEQWMGWPVDASYEQSSNVVDAHKLGGALLLTVGELDSNVDPASTMQVVDALIKANKDFNLIVFPGAGHGAGSGRYGTRQIYDFFVRNLYGMEPRRE